MLVCAGLILDARNRLWVVWEVTHDGKDLTYTPSAGQ
jgi:hypothetical protein